MSKARSPLALAGVLAATLAACAGPGIPDTGCHVDSDCSPGLVCVAGGCEPKGGSDGGSDGGTLSGTLSLTPATATLTGVVGEGGSTSFVLGNVGQAELHFTVTCTQGATPSPASGAIAVDDSAAITVSFAAWTSTGAKTVVCTADPTDTPDASLTFTASVTVAPAPQGNLTLSPATASTNAQVNQPGTSSFELGNDGNAALAWAVACSQGTPAPASGTLAAGGSASVSVSFPAYAATGTNTLTCTATTSNGTGGPRTLTLTITVGASALGHLTRTPATVSGTGITGQGGSTSFTLGNDGAASLAWAVSCTGGATPSPASGTLVQAATQAITVTYATWTTVGTKALVCTATTSNGSGGPLAFTATVVVTAPPMGHVTLTPTTRSLSALVNQTTTTTFTLGNDGTASLSAGITCTNASTATPTPVTIAKTTTQAITVAIPSFAAAGTQTIVCTADPTDTPDASLTFTVTLNVFVQGSTASPCGTKGAIWSDLDGLTGSALKSALTARVVPTKPALSYSAAGNYVHGSVSIDKQADGTIECIYSGERVSAASNGFNTEHSWPQSFFNEALPMKSDLHHLFPTNSTPNGRRANFGFDTVTCAASSCTYASTETCGSSGSCTSGGVSLLGKNALGDNAFEVRMKQRGNTARAMFYFATRYPDLVDSTDSTCYGASDSNDRPRCLPSWEQTTLKAWSEQDPVDATECARNDAVEALQGNRNPFIDRPDFIAKIGSF